MSLNIGLPEKAMSKKRPKEWPKEQSENLPNKHFGTQLHISDIVKLLWGQKLLITGTIVLAAALSIWFALTTDEIYMAELRAIPSESSLTTDDNSLQSTLGLRMKGFSTAVGEYEKHLVAVQVLHSRNFILDFIQQHNLLPFIYGVKSWNPDTQALTWHEDIYNSRTGQWVTDAPPTLQEATQLFILNNLKVSDNRDSRLLTIQVYHPSAILAAQWASLLIENLNNHMRNKQITEANEKLSFYQQQLAITLNPNTQDVIRQQIEEVSFTKLVINSQPHFLFEVIDPPMVPEKRAYPRRGLLVALGTFFGGILALLLAFIKILLFPPHEQLQQSAAGEKGVA